MYIFPLVTLFNFNETEMKSKVSSYGFSENQTATCNPCNIFKKAKLLRTECKPFIWLMMQMDDMLWNWGLQEILLEILVELL